MLPSPPTGIQGFQFQALGSISENASLVAGGVRRAAPLEKFLRAPLKPSIGPFVARRALGLIRTLIFDLPARHEEFAGTISVQKLTLETIFSSFWRAVGVAEAEHARVGSQ